MFSLQNYFLSVFVINPFSMFDLDIKFFLLMTFCAKIDSWHLALIFPYGWLLHWWTKYPAILISVMRLLSFFQLSSIQFSILYQWLQYSVIYFSGFWVSGVKLFLIHTYHTLFIEQYFMGHPLAVSSSL